MGQRFWIRITSKGQITIPHTVRKQMGVHEGDTVAFEMDADGIRILPVQNTIPFGRYQGIGNRGNATGREGIDAWLRDLRG